MTLENARSFNNKLVVEAYKRESGPRAEVHNGWGRGIGQKATLKGLKVLVGAQLPDGTFIPTGSTAYIKEETLHTGAWAGKILKSDTLPDEFIIAPMSEVEYIVPPSNDAA